MHHMWIEHALIELLYTGRCCGKEMAHARVARINDQADSLLRVALRVYIHMGTKVRERERKRNAGNPSRCCPEWGEQTRWQLASTDGEMEAYAMLLQPPFTEPVTRE